MVDSRGNFGLLFLVVLGEGVLLFVWLVLIWFCVLFYCFVLAVVALWGNIGTLSCDYDREECPMQKQQQQQ